MSGFLQEAEAAISRYLHARFRFGKPISCSTCMTHWVGLLVLLCSGELTLMSYAALLLVAISTDLIQGIIRLAKDIIVTLIRTLYILIEWKRR